MNKTVKGSLAGAAGIALLMGGFGSYALWSESRPLASTSVTSGELTIGTDTSTAYWDDVNTAATKDWSAGDKMVPGDKVSYTQTFTITGTGKNLSGDVSLADLGAMTNNGTAFTKLDRTVSISDPDDAGTVFTRTNDTKVHFSSPFNSTTITATVVYTFRGDAATGATGVVDQNASAITPAAQFTIAQG